jgi:transcription elongation factor GreA
MSTTKTTFLSKKGFKELKKEIARLERDRHATILRLRELDKTDNHEEQLIRAEQLSIIEALENELYEKQEILRSARAFPRKRDALRVAIGSVVDLLDTNGRILRYTVVESIEADPSDGRISVLSPLGKNLVGKQIKDVVEWSAGIGTRQLQLISIH